MISSILYRGTSTMQVKAQPKVWTNVRVIGAHEVSAVERDKHCAEAAAQVPVVSTVIPAAPRCVDISFVRADTSDPTHKI